MGERLCKGLTLWHPITGCDTVSVFNEKGKKTAWKVWRSFNDGVDTFARLSATNGLSEDDMSVIERFIILMYDPTSSTNNINACRRELFKKRAELWNTSPQPKMLYINTYAEQCYRASFGITHLSKNNQFTCQPIGNGSYVMGSLCLCG